MPREGRRSVGYRPFITCDDPRGVVECGTTITRHKSVSQRTKHKNPNRIVTSWSSCKHIKSYEDDKAKDLPTGAVDLEESMGMLSKLEKEACDDDRRLDSSDAPSTSTSRSSIVHSSSFMSPESVVSSSSSKKMSNKKPNGSSLMAKLMGTKYGMKKDLGDENEKIVNHEHDSGQKKRRLDQLIEALRFKGSSKTTKLNVVKSYYWSSIAVMRPSKFSCLNLENPVIPKPRSEVDKEMLLKMRVRTNPLADPHEFHNLNEEEIAADITKGKASPPGKSRPHKNKMLEKKVEEAQKANGGSRIKAERKETPNSETHFHLADEDKPTASSSSSEQNWPKSDEEVSPKDVQIANVDERFREECESVPLFLLEDSTRLAEDVSQIEITDYVDDELSSTTAPDIEEEEISSCATSTPFIDYSGSRKCSTGENKLKQLLLSSPSFINQVQNLFDLKEGNLDKVGNVIDDKDLSTQMLLDTANELVELHGQECSRACLPLPSSYKTCSVTCYCLDQLLDQVCEEIEAFGCYIKDVGESPLTDNLVLLVEKDLRSRKMIDGVWDVGWRNVGSADEVEEIAKGVEELVFDGLIEEILVDLTV